ncbi:helix-turn-helix domain-containing protein [Silvimonas sp.]|uniref:helix-turn-helix domain-containing protein n=1 Tax=Silvimonas sp. TaxID=2650811 RepID=UPI0028429E29|nr:helix-turn-helix domain-containing protein [Silvimonas sp.]MDR3429994.1 helix-turn-helix domain-containing protein [Silvimonas sp.]
MKKKNRHPVSQSSGAISNANSTLQPPIVTGQCAEVLELIRSSGPILSLELTANCAIPETAARVHDLRAKGFNVQTVILPSVMFRGRERRNVARYSLGVPEWPAPGFLDGEAT